MPGGRPSKLTPERQQKLVAAIEAGNYYEVACTLAGIDYTTFRGWMRAGESGENPKYVKFFNIIRGAEAQAEQNAIIAWQKAFPDDWRAAQMFLERRHPDRWGKQDRLDLKQQVQGKVAMEHGVNTTDANALLAALGFGPLGSIDPGDPGDGAPGDPTPATD